MSNILTIYYKKHHHPDCYVSCRLIFLPCLAFILLQYTPAQPLNLIF